MKKFSQKFDFETKAHGKVTLEVTNNGFTLWTHEKSKKTGRIIDHWVLAASCLSDDGNIIIGNSCSYEKIIKYYSTGPIGARLVLEKASKQAQANTKQSQPQYLKAVEALKQIEEYADYESNSASNMDPIFRVWKMANDALGELYKMTTDPQPVPQSIEQADEAIKMLERICNMQERHYGNGMTTHMKLSTLVKESRELLSKIKADQTK